MIPLTKPCHSLSCSILLACLISKPLFSQQSCTISIYLFCGLPNEQLHANTPLSYIITLTDPITLHSLQIAEVQENTINPLHHSVQLLIRAFGTLSILLIPSKLLRLSSLNCRPLLLLPYIRTGTISVLCKTLAHSSYKSPSLARDLIAPAILLLITTFLIQNIPSI